MKKNVISYVVIIYVVFWILLFIAGGILFVTKNPMVGKLAAIPFSWVPNIVLFCMLKRFYPEKTRKEYIKGLFAEKINIPLVGILVAVQTLAFIGSLLCASSRINWETDLSLSAGAIAINFINCMLTGATGEEGGWSGFLHPILTQKYGVVKGSSVVGVIWGFWHAPLWFLSYGYTGWDLVKYVVFFLIFTISAAIIIGICYKKNKNILIPVIIHFLTNFTMGFYNKDVINIVGYFALFYVIICAGCIMWWKKVVLPKQITV